MAHAPDRVGDLRAVRGDGAALAGRHDLARMEGQAAEPPEPAARHPAPPCAERAGRVLEELHPRRKRALERLPVERPAEQVDGDHRPRAWGHGGRRPPGIEVHRPRVDVDEHRRRAHVGDDVRRRRERVRRHEHLVAGPEAEREHGQVERCRPGRDDERVLDGAGLRQQRLELGHLRPHRELPALEHLGHRGRLRGAHVGAREPDQASAGLRSRYHAMVRASPSSRSTFASKPSS